MIKEVKMKRKRKWWIWLLIALVCMIIVFVIAEITGASIISTFGWGILGVFGVLGVILALILSVFVIAPIVMIIRLLLGYFISNKEILFVTLGSLGFCAILVGWILTIRQNGWSLLVMMVGFALGCVAGVEYQKHALSGSNESEGRLGQIPDETKEG